jgi:hypothetical protein
VGDLFYLSWRVSRARKGVWSVVRVMRARARREFWKMSRNAVSLEEEFRKFLGFWFVSEGAHARARRRARLRAGSGIFSVFRRARL